MTRKTDETRPAPLATAEPAPTERETQDVVTRPQRGKVAERGLAPTRDAGRDDDSTTRRPGVSPKVDVAPAQPGRYRVEGEIAGGGMGVIHRVEDRSLARIVAQKRLVTELARSPSHAGLLVREACVTAGLEHPHIVPVHDLALGDDGELFFTMKLVEGRALSSWISTRTAGELPRWEELLDQLDVAIKVCDALSFAHANGVIHCDVKPANVMVGDHGQVYLMDWGLARLLVDEQRREPNQVSWQLIGVGTPGYMPPEQALGMPLDVRADVFAVGAMLYCLVCGRSPYHDRSNVVASTVFELPTSLTELCPALAPALSRIIMKALSTEPSDRYASVHALKTELVRFVRGGETFDEMTYEASTTIVREGEPGDTAFIIQSGRCEVTIGGKVVRHMGPGEVFGEMALLSSGTRTATVRALELTVLRRIDGARFREELDAMKPWMGALMRTLAARLVERR